MRKSKHIKSWQGAFISSWWDVDAPGSNPAALGRACVPAGAALPVLSTNTAGTKMAPAPSSRGSGKEGTVHFFLM